MPAPVSDDPPPAAAETLAARLATSLPSTAAVQITPVAVPTAGH